MDKIKDLEAKEDEMEDDIEKYTPEDLDTDGGQEKCSDSQETLHLSQIEVEEEDIPES